MQTKPREEIETVGDILDNLPPPDTVRNLPQAAPMTSATALMRIIERAVESPDFDVAKLEKLLEVKERWEANEARKAFVAALAAFRQHPPTIAKNKGASFEGKSGRGASYDYATLDQVCGLISPALSRQGLSHRWETAQADGKIRVTCILTHELGHSECVSLEAGADTTGAKNAIQAIGSTVTYLERYTLLAATGLAAGGQDDDALGAAATNGDGFPGFITPEQKETLIALLKETGADVKRFLEYLGVASLDEMPAAKFASATAALARKKEKAK